MSSTQTNTTFNNNGTQTRAVQIERIIEKRQPLAKRIQIAEDNLIAVSNLLKQVEEKRNILTSKVNDPTQVNKLDEINYVTSVIGQINLELNALKKLKSRFSRPTLNIGVVGRARQGKSRLLQSLTGLSKAEIPDGDDQHCTGVRSNIYHKPGIETYAEIYFHSESSFLNEAIAPYYQQLNLGKVPQSIELFAESTLPELDTEKTALDRAKYEHLKKYHQHIQEYRQFFHQNTLRISKEQIRQYVAQDTIEGDRIYCYLAVKKVDIYCSFPNQDIGQIALVDMPGLGDTGVGDAEDSSLKLAVKQAIEHCRSHPGVPNVEQILKKRDRHASFESAYSECQHEVRTRLSKRFLSLDRALEESLESAKSKVVRVLTEHGRLRNIADGNGREFLFDLESKIPEDLTSLKLGFQTLATFDLQYRGLIQHRIRKHLDVLTPDRTKYKLNDLFSNFFGQSNSNQEKAKKIYSNLRQAQTEAVNNCERELNNLLIEPNQAGFAIVEEFVDRVLRAEGIREEWEIFLQEFAHKVWQDEFESISANGQLKKEWIDTIEKVEQKVRSENFQFSQ